MKVTNSSPSLFITATDTGVGKTVITGALILALRQQGKQVGIFKPIETGVNPQREDQSDVGRLRGLVFPPPSAESMCLYRYEAPLAPLACSRLTDTTIDPATIFQHQQDISQQHDITLIEGAGGLLTPLTPTHTVLDLIIRLRVPCLVVSRTDLGAVNHVLLTLRILQQAGIPILALVLNEPTADNASPTTALQRASSVKLIREFAQVPVWGPLGYEEKLLSDWARGVGQLAHHQEIQRLAMSLV